MELWGFFLFGYGFYWLVGYIRYRLTCDRIDREVPRHRELLTTIQTEASLLRAQRLVEWPSGKEI